MKTTKIELNYKCWILVLSFIIHSLAALSPSELSLEEKVGQVLMVHFHGREANEEAKRLIQETYIGGIIYYTWANELNDPQQVQNLSAGLQKLTHHTPHAIPLLIAVDQEGGRVNRLKQGFTIFPGNYALGQTGKWEWGTESARAIGEELKAVGISLNLAPVMDVNTNPNNRAIGIRAFGSDPAKVALWGKYVLQGYKQAGVIAALKHFPGHGDVKTDSHEALPIVDKKLDALKQVELLPFRVLASQADAILTAHLLVPALDTQNCVTFSEKIVNDLLRKDFNFQGIIITDSLAMEGALSQCSSIEEAALKSLQAGHDLILLGGKQLLASQNGFEISAHDVRRVHHFLINAVKEGRLSEKRLDDAVARLIALKQNYGLFDAKPLESSCLMAHVNTPSHQSLAQQIASHALHLVKGSDSLPLKLQQEPLLIVAPDCMQSDIVQTSWHTLGPQVQIIYFKGVNPDQETIQEILAANKKTKQCIFFAYNLWQFSGQQELFQKLIEASTPIVAIAVRDRLDADYMTAAHVVLCTFSPVACSLQAAFDYLKVKP
jgi:beta-N-acetylhexosaminidase